MSENKRSKLIPLLGYAIPILLIVYVLSVGPAAALITDSKGVLTHPEYVSQFESFYAPLGFVVERNDSLEYLAGQYIAFCIERF